ncbi:hypothetical protein CDL60_12865 [Roseateles noduli]|nr:hypothetical protein CDL60_12865 [Roseateles noduli]
MFTLVTMNHFRAIKAWADAHGGEATLDIASFELEVKARHRYYKLLPQFIHDQNGRLLHVGSLMPDATSFIGWRPYAPRRLALSTDKLDFKRAAAAAGLATPAHWDSARDAQTDFILKRSVGSFGYQLAGPYHRGEDPALPAALTARTAGRVFAEAFIPGQILKVWFWGARPVHVHNQSYPMVRGDGVSTLDALVAARLGEFGETWATYGEREQVLGALAYQGLALDEVLADGRTVWFDYRYGRRFAPQFNSEALDNAWHAMPDAQREQLLRAGVWLAQALQSEINLPMLVALDGVLDAQGKIWWLELNSNPVCPPTAYFEMFATLFGTPPQAPDAAYARNGRVFNSATAGQTPAPNPGAEAARVPETAA